MQSDLIIINDFCDRCHVDPSFITELEEDGLIEVRVIDEERYLPASQLAELERYTHLYYDLSINIAGIDAIHHIGTYRTFATGSAFIEKRIGILPLNSVSGEGK